MSDSHVKPPPEEAAGLGAALSTAKVTATMGVVRGVRTLLRLNQQGGFDCPGCAWPEPRERSFFEFCENGVKHVADEATPLRADAEFFANHSVEQLAEQSDEWLNAQGRLTEPMVLREGATHYEPVSWDDAFALVARELSRMSTPNAAVFYTSGRTSNEAAFLYQLFVRQLGTNNLPDCSNMCHESSGTALKEVVGVGKGTVHLEDFEVADAIFVIGQNPGSNHPRMLTALEAAAKRGCQIVAINPLREPGLVRFSHPQHYESLLARGTPIAALYLQVRIGGDAALLRGIQKEMLEQEDRAPGSVLDRAFIDEHTTGFDALARAVRATPWETIEEQSGLSRAEIREAAVIAMRSERTIACWAMGLTQHKHSVATIQEVVNLMLLRGNLGRPGAGLCPVRGHSNVQGDRTMGISEHMPAAFLDRLGREYDFDPPREPGFDTVASIEAMLAGKVSVFFAMGGNFLSAAPDTDRTAEALRKCELTAHVATKLNRSHVVTGRRALILPCLGRTELDLRNGAPQFVSVENSMGLVHPSQGRNAPAGERLRSEPAIVAGLAKAVLGSRSKVDWDALASDYDRIRDGIAHVVDGCADYNARVREPGGFYLRNGARERDFAASGGRARFSVNELPSLELRPGELLMMTVRSHDQFNTTVYTQNDRYRGISGNRRVIFMNEADITELGLAAGEEVDLVSHWQGEERRAPAFTIVPFSVPRRCTATYFPEANPLVPLGSYADKSRTPTSKSVVITIHKRGG
ncbi:MAG TPA: FdhF/YdeP family oxidoreductase [Polyangiaceae bacterium]|nr:FdhF/YdeP family oxidoreductase [Polyangiaceae bacterium]